MQKGRGIELPLLAGSAVMERLEVESGALAQSPVQVGGAQALGLASAVAFVGSWGCTC